jgi:maltooligosyltrehalose synthase
LASLWPSYEGDDTDLLPRLLSFVEKALREAKLHTSWTDINECYGKKAARSLLNGFLIRQSGIS